MLNTPLNTVIASENAAAFDAPFYKLRGFDTEQVSLCKSIEAGKTWIEYEKPLVISNFAKAKS